MSELKPCPFCGGKAKWEGSSRSIVVHLPLHFCRANGLRTHVDNWNRRPQAIDWDITQWACQCGASVNGRWAYCPQCGRKVSDSTGDIGAAEQDTHCRHHEAGVYVSDCPMLADPNKHGQKCPEKPCRIASADARS